ncbi:MAG: radical SAM protein [Clostridia bacterium]|nr:radical SAM protein [Clostridia bacterium]
MSFSKRILKYAAGHYREVVHTTLNPEGPGVVRIHLIPPKTVDGKIGDSVAIINGQDIIPVSPSWGVLLCEFISHVNRYRGREITDQDTADIISRTTSGVRKVFPFISKKKIASDVYRIMDAFRHIAYNEPVDEEIGYMSIGQYAPYMRAPHRMDLMISAMSQSGAWHCNQKCVHCYAAGQMLSGEKELSSLDWMHIIDRCRLAGVTQVTFTGGEPTMREDLVELIEHAKWFVTRLNTNGRKLSPGLCARLRAASLDSMQITFYSYDRGIHNALVGANGYDDTLSGIRNALKAGISVSVNTPLCTLNKDYVKTLELLHSEGVIYVTCSGLITTGNAAEEKSASMQLSSEEIGQILTDAVNCCNENGMQISFTSPGWADRELFEKLGINAPVCGACLSNMAITPGGNVVPCQSWLDSEPLGNMLSDSWETIWDSERCAAIRAESAKMTGLCPLRRRSGQ